MPSRIYSEEKVTITVEMTETEAYAFAQFIKRSYWSQYRENAVDDEDAYNMIYAGGKIRKALAEEGFAPR